MQKNLKLYAILLFFALSSPFLVQAANIGNTSGHSWAEKFGYIKMNGGDIDYGVTVADTNLSGYSWSEKTGWINFNDTGELYAVINDGNGNLSGYAWSEKLGYISFDDSSANEFYQVIIDAGGNFSGYAWSEKAGYINMDDTGELYKVITDHVTPTLTTQAASSVESTTATLNGNITDVGGDNPTVTVYWGDNDGGQGTWDFSSAPTTPAQPQGVASFSKNVTGLDPGTLYYFSAKAVNSVGTSWPAASLSFLTKPATPTNVVATDGNYTDKVTITWTKSTGATGYKVYEGANLIDTLGDVATYDDTAAGAPSITPGTTVSTDGTVAAHVALSLDGASANNGASRTYKVVATNATGSSADSSTDTGYRGPGALTYQWQKSSADSDASYSNIDGATSSTYSDTAAPIYTVNAPTSVTVTTVSSSVLRTAFSGASVTSGEGRYYQAILNATGATQQISSSDRGYRDDTVASSDGYEIFSDTASGGAYATDEGADTASPFDDTGLNPNIRKYYKVKAKSTANTFSALSTSYDGAYTDANTPSAPTSSGSTISTITVLDNQINSNPSDVNYTLYAEAGSTCDGYGGWYLSSSGTPSTIAVWQTDTEWSTITASELNENTSYAFCSKAKGINTTETPWSAALSASTSNAGLSISSSSSTQAQPNPQTVGGKITFAIEWTADSGTGETAKVHICKTNILPSFACEIGEVWCESTSFTDSNPQTCQFTTTSAEVTASPNNFFYSFICDNENNCTAGDGGSFSVNDIQASFSKLRLR